MKILMATDFYPPYIGGGVENVVHEISKRLVHHGHEVHVLTRSLPGSPTYEDYEGVLVTRVNFHDLTKILGLQSSISWKLESTMEKMVSTIKPDIINAHNIFFFSSYVAANIRNKINCPLVTTLHVSDLGEVKGVPGLLSVAYEKVIGRHIIKKSDKIITVSDSVRKHAIDLGANESSIATIKNAVDTTLFKPRNRTSKQLQIVYVGRLVSNKGPEIFLESASQISRLVPNATFTMIGDGPLKTHIIYRIKELGLEDRLEIKPCVPKLSNFLPQYDILIRPTTTEGLPLTVLEGMASGLVVIASKVGGVPEVIEDGVNGFLTKPGSIEEIIKTVNRISKDTQLLNQIKLNARKSMETFNSWDNVTEETIKVFQNTINNKQSR
jgi:glycosyltransferase involved in cell wall biosynthesis